MGCPVIMKATVPGRLELAKKARLCFSCLNRGHSKNDCQSKKKCEKSDSCPYFHHPLLHSNPPAPSPVGNMNPVSAAQTGAASVLDKISMMPVIRAIFRAPNGRVREGNVLIDSGAGNDGYLRAVCKRPRTEREKRTDRFSSSWRRKVKAAT